MALSPGTRLGTYEIIQPIGAGGMGEVYRARDSKLNRDVALKILPESFASDADRIARFTREARTLASLNHPHIAQVYDTGQHGATAFIAMEFVDGEDLAARISRGAVPWREAMPIARQIADALAAAHDAGIVHRDLKPANIKVRDDGTVKVLDFGLAKALATETAEGDGGHGISNSPTLTAAAFAPGYAAPGTQLGMILGTAPYMSPEQAKGRPVDRRADVWAFGVVLHEMLTGAYLFGRDDVTETLAAVLTHELDHTKLPADTPPSVRRLLARCLTKDKRDRLDSMTVARIEIEESANSRETAAPAAAGSSRWLVPALAAGIVMFGLGWAAAAFLASGSRTAGAPAAQPIFSTIAAPEAAVSAFHNGFELSPDGGVLAFIARDQSGVRQVWTRRLNSLEAQPVRGTEGAIYPFWSPDSLEIGFFVDGKLRRVPAAGGPALSIGDAPGLFPTGAWGPGNVIMFSAFHAGRLSLRKIAASGGDAIEMKEAGEGMRPKWLPDGKRFIFRGGDATGWGLRIASIDGGPSKLIHQTSPGNWGFEYSSGYVFLNRNDALTAQRLDPATDTLIGPVIPIGGLAGESNTWFALSVNGDRLVGYLRGSEKVSPSDPRSRLEWVNRDGDPLGVLGRPGRYWTANLSPNGDRVAVSQGADVLLMSGNGGQVRLTAGNESWNGIWARDGSEILMSSSFSDVVRRSPAVGAEPIPLKGLVGNPEDWSRDKALVLTANESATRGISIYDTRTGTMKPWLVTPFFEGSPRFSPPDDKWVAFVSDESGRLEVSVRSLDGSDRAVPISQQGGVHPKWRRDGRELFFLAPDGSIMAADITVRGSTIVAGRPHPLFRIQLNDIGAEWFSPYDVDALGQRFLLNIPERPEPLLFLQGLEAFVERKGK